MSALGRYLRKADVIAGLAVTLAGIGLFTLSAAIEINPLESTLSARVFPFLLALGLIICGLLTLRQGLRADAPALPAFNLWRIAAIALPLLAYYYWFEQIDFRLSTTVYVLLTMLLLGARRWQEWLLLPPAVAGSIYLLFVYGFGTLLPTWN